MRTIADSLGELVLPRTNFGWRVNSHQNCQNICPTWGKHPSNIQFWNNEKKIFFSCQNRHRPIALPGKNRLRPPRNHYLALPKYHSAHCLDSFNSRIDWYLWPKTPNCLQHEIEQLPKSPNSSYDILPYLFSCALIFGERWTCSPAH